MRHLASIVPEVTRSGNFQYATLESFNAGLASVLLSENGARLTNLRCIGTTFLLGETVVVDYSMNVPTVRKIVNADSLFGFTELAPLETDQTIVTEDENYGCDVHHRPDLTSGQPTYGNTRFLLNFGPNEPPYEDGYVAAFAAYYDNGEMADKTSLTGRNYVEIPVSGKWLINFSYSGGYNNNYPFLGTYGGGFDGYLNDRNTIVALDSYMEVRILKNFSTVLGIDRVILPLDEVGDMQGSGNTYDGFNQTVIALLQKGDKISYEIFFTPNTCAEILGYPVNTGEMIFDLHTGCELILQFIPGTMEVT